MADLDFKPNSYKSREGDKETEERTKRVEKVIAGNAKTRKKNAGSKIAESFFSEDVHSIGNYALMDVIIPALKKTLYDVITNSFDMLLFGGTGRSKRTSEASRVSYRNYYDRRDDRDRYSREPASRPRYGHDDVVVDSRAEAEEVINRMNEVIDTYGMVSVADLYDLVGMKPEYTDNKYGWTNIRNAEPIRVRDGYMIKLPKAIPID